MDKELLSKISLLIVEDDDNAIIPLEFILKRYVKTIYIERNGKDGLESFKQNRPDVVLTDIQMPIMNGIDMAEEIRKINHHTPIIYTTGHTEIDLVIKAIDAGADGFLLKPIMKDKLINRLVKSTKIIISDKCILNDAQFIHKFMEMCNE